MARADEIVRTLETRLRSLGTPARAAGERAYLKSALVHLGVTVPAIRREARAVVIDDRTTLLAVVKALWARGIHELRMAAVELLEKYIGLVRVADAPLLERMLRESRTWALVDPLAAIVVGELLEREPRLAARIEKWARDPDFWLRRAALLVHLGPLRRGGGDFATFGRHADAMLDESEFFIRKAIGWVLRDMSRKRPDEVFTWLLPRAHRLSGVTRREAEKYLSASQRAQLRDRLSRPPRPARTPRAGRRAPAASSRARGGSSRTRSRT